MSIATFRTGALLALVSPLCLAAIPLETHTFFPAQPGFGDALYVLHPSSCDDQNVPASDPTLTRFVASDGAIEWILAYDVSPAACETAPQHVTTYAFALPADVGSRATDTFRIKLTHLGPGQVLSSYPLALPIRVGMPPSVAGTWFNLVLARQGLMLGYDPDANVTVSWHTYAADGTPRWNTGVAPAPQDDSGMTVALNSIESGVFGGGSATADEITRWGEVTLQYAGCGQMFLDWSAGAATGLSSGSALLQQLSGNFAAECDLDAWAQRNATVIAEIVPELIDLPARTD